MTSDIVQTSEPGVEEDYNPEDVFLELQAEWRKKPVLYCEMVHGTKPWEVQKQILRSAFENRRTRQSFRSFFHEFR